jgi:hypothetical protein
MHYYQVGSDDYSGSYFVTLMHETLYTEDEIFGMVADATVVATDEQTKRHEELIEWDSKNGATADILARYELDGGNYWFGSYVPEIVESLILKYGFQHIPHTVSVVIDGGHLFGSGHKDYVGQIPCAMTMRLEAEVVARCPTMRLRQY